MTSHPDRSGFWSATLNWLRAFDEAVHHDPTEILQHRIDHLEAKLRDTESASRTAPETHE